MPELFSASVRFAACCSFVLVLASSCEGCTCDEDASEAVPIPVRVAPPSGMVWEATTGGGPGVLGEIRALVPEPINVAMPSTPGAIFERIVPHLALAEVVPTDATVHAIAVSVEASAGLVVAVRVPIPAGAELAPGLPFVDGAPHGGRWVGEAPGASSPAAMVLGDVLIASDHPATLELGAPYVAWAVARGGVGGEGEAREGAPGITVRFPETFAGRSLRRIIEVRTFAWSESARESIGRERARHEEPPAFGDPEALVALVEERARAWLAYLPDIGEVRVTAHPSQVGLVVRLDADVPSGSPLARALDAQGAVAPEAMLSLPDGAAGAWISARADGEDPSLAREAIERLGGDRLDEGARAQLAAAESSIRSADVAIAAIGSTEGSPWLLVGTRPALDPEPLRTALGAAFVRDVGGALFGCERALAPAPFRDEIPVRVSQLCGMRGAASDDRGVLPPPMLLSATADQASAIAVARGEAASPPAAIVVRTAERLAGRSAAGGAESSPDIARTVGALDDPALAAGLVVPSRIFGAAALLPVFGRAAGGGGRPAPIGVSLSRTEDGLRVTIVATEDALADLAAVLAPFLAD